MILVLYLVTGWIARVEAPAEACRLTLEQLRRGERVVAVDALGNEHEVERAACIEKPALSAEARR